MNKTVIKIVVKTVFSVIFMGIAMLLFIGMLVDYTGGSYGLDSNLEYVYEYGRYNDLSTSFVWYDASGDRYDDDWFVNEANKLRYDYKIYQKLYEQTADAVYEEKMQQAKEEIDSCMSQMKDEYKKDVVRMFLLTLNEEE